MSLSSHPLKPPRLSRLSLLSRRSRLSGMAVGVLGFSLLEVLVSVLLVSVGILGVSKMQAAGLSNTQLARTRSLVAFQASSLAALMHGNPAYWARSGAVQLAAAGSSDITGSFALALTSVSKDCTTTPCSAVELAAYDLKQWMAGMNAHFPSYDATIACTAVASTSTSPALPTQCLLRLTWDEKYVAVNRSTASAAGAVQLGRPDFTLVVQP